MARPIPLRPDPAAVTARSVEALTRTIIVEAQARIDKRSDEATLARERWPDDPLVPLMLRAATQPNALPNPTLGTSIVSDLLTVVGATGGGAKLLQSGLMLTFDRHAAIFVPGLEAAADQIAFVGESSPIPVRDLTTTSVTLQPHKLSSIVVVSAEMLASTNVERIVSSALSRSVGLSIDSVLFDAQPASQVRPAGLRCGIAASVASSNPYVREAMVADMATLAGAVAPIGGPIAYIAAPGRAATINLWASRELPYPILASQALAAADLICIAVDGLASAVDAAPVVDSSKYAAIHMDDPFADR